MFEGLREIFTTIITIYISECDQVLLIASIPPTPYRLLIRDMTSFEVEESSQ